MPKIFTLIAVFVLTTLNAFAQNAPLQKPSAYIEEMQSLGSVAGQGLACDASKYHTFELLARAIMISKAQSDDQQANGMQAYNESKAEAFISTLDKEMGNCLSINDAFNNQLIFKATLYGDGTIKMPDGKIITPRHPYDATQVYIKDTTMREKYLKMYQDKKQKILQDPNYQRALREAKAKYNF